MNSRFSNYHFKESIALILAGMMALAAGVAIWYLFIHSPLRDNTQAVVTQGATLLPEARQLQGFTLTDHTGSKFSNDRLRNYWTFFSFGYTHCPDVCPTTLNTLKKMNQQLKSRGVTTPYQIVFVSIDPDRDSLQRLSEYLGYFDQTFIGATAHGDSLSSFTRSLGIIYQKVNTPQSGLSYIMDHSAAIVLVNPEGQYHALFGSPHDANMMTEDVIAIFSGY